MAAFKDKNFNLIYVHVVLQSLVMHGGEGFAFIYLLKAGISIPVVLLCIAAMFASRILFRMAVVPISITFGLRRTLIAAVVVEGATYLLLPMVTETGPILYLYLALWAASSSFYWTTYHTYVARIGSNERRGTQVSVMEFFGTFAAIVAPLIMGFLLTWFNPWVGFGFVTASMLLAALPFVFGPEVEVKKTASLSAETKNYARLIMFTDGLRFATTHFFWLIVLFLTLSSNYIAFGGALAVAGITGALMGLITGRWFDLGRSEHATRLGFGAITLASIAKCFGYHVPWSAVASNALNAAAWPSYATAFNSQVYNLARKSSCALRFHVVAEGGWDMGTAAGCSIAALLVYLDFGFFWPLTIGVASCVLGYTVVTRNMRT
jgi:MFS transporter, DHA1 family, inner membrane transport protein